MDNNYNNIIEKIEFLSKRIELLKDFIDKEEVENNLEELFIDLNYDFTLLYGIVNTLTLKNEIDKEIPLNLSDYIEEEIRNFKPRNNKENRFFKEIKEIVCEMRDLFSELRRIKGIST